MLARPLFKYAVFCIVCHRPLLWFSPGASHRPDRDLCTSASKQMWGEAGENGQLVLREDRRFNLRCSPHGSRPCGAHFGSLQTGSPAGHFNLALPALLVCPFQHPAFFGWAGCCQSADLDLRVSHFFRKNLAFVRTGVVVMAQCTVGRKV